MKNKNIVILTLIIIIILAIIGYFIGQKIQKERRKYEIETISEYKYFVVKENNKYGVIDSKGNKIIETEYENVKIPNPEKDVFICYKNESTEILNEKKEKILTEYENIEPLRLKNVQTDLMYEKSVLKYSKDGKYGIINLAGKKITNAIYEEIDTLQFKEGELLVKKDGKYGVINIKGTTLVKPQYDKIEVDKFYEEGNGYKKAGYIVSNTTEEGYRYGYINIEGKKIIDTKYNDLYRVMEVNSDDVYIICAENGKYGLLKNGKQIINNEYQSLVYNESNNTVTALKGKKYGVISINGKTIIPFEYKQIDISGEYIYTTTADDNTKVYDSNGKETNIQGNMAIINVENTDYKIYINTQNDKTTYSIYKDEQELTKNKYTYITYLFDNYFIACNENGKLGVIDNSEKTQIEFMYNSMQQIENTNMIQAVNNSTKKTEIYSKEMKKICELENATIENNIEYLKIYNDNEIKYISKDEKEVENKEVFKNNKIFAKQQGSKWGFVDANENMIVDYNYDKVTEVNKYGFAGIKQNGKWGVIDSNGKIIVEPQYKLSENDPIFIGQYYQVIYGNGEIYYTK
jgi:KWG leptospira repeat protein